MAGETEEKNLPASQRKLRKAREKGQVASSTDFVNAVILVSGLIVILMSWPRYIEVFTSAIRVALEAAQRANGEMGARTLSNLVVLIGQTLLPLLLIVSASGFVAHVIFKKGLVFSMDPIKPDFTRLDPAKGFERIFSAKNGAEFGIALLRCLVWFTAAGLILWYAAPQILIAPDCGLPCIGASSFEVMQKLLILAVLLMIVIGLLDLPFQSFMFLKEQKMSRTEMKKEMKEMEGSPEVAGFRREQHREFANGGGRSNSAMTMVVISSGEAVALSYDVDKQPIPIVVAKGQGVHADAIIASAKRLNIPIEVDPRLAGVLIRTGIGGMVAEREFNAVAVALVRHGKAGGT